MGKLDVRRAYLILAGTSCLAAAGIVVFVERLLRGSHHDALWGVLGLLTGACVTFVAIYRGVMVWLRRHPNERPPPIVFRRTDGGASRGFVASLAIGAVAVAIASTPGVVQALVVGVALGCFTVGPTTAGWLHHRAARRSNQ
jgi:uncharacterized iron-regulated membrane protein